MQKAFAFTYTLGAAPMPDITRSKLLLIWGKQPSCVATCPGEALKYGTIESLAELSTAKQAGRLSAETMPSFFISGRLTGAVFLSVLNSDK
jgi:Fe-S-cluster-containing dehydrogenase component